jgi:hypothetical protein
MKSHAFPELGVLPKMAGIVEPKLFDFIPSDLYRRIFDAVYLPLLRRQCTPLSDRVKQHLNEIKRIEIWAKNQSS